ncbi:hypothetical protein BDZ85DRAFT_231295 [Elsinoe ampelina]|uniref:Zn(2)-C6 fungal-type domain-containing protein n=1 Tax=Elsinoe ampelina TaxID=302913 RepID=A0A6A6GIB4_9PEZI|nr:hypothetical protein BDZ85DRAFT_231295 [Elsinoe ampelina]
MAPISPTDSAHPGAPSANHAHQEGCTRRKSQSDETVAQPKPKRRKKACEACRLRKTKCDNARPTCGICQTTKSACKYEQNEQFADHLTLESVTGILTRQLETLQRSVDSLQRQSLIQSQVPTLDIRPSTISVVSHDQGLQSEPNLDCAVTEASADFLQIPAQRTCADSILKWPVFEGHFEANALVKVLFLNHDMVTSKTNSGITAELPTEERILVLVNGFLQNVHTKNPVLDVGQLLGHARRCALEGFGWDQYSCLVLLACALGSIAHPFDIAALSMIDGQTPPSTLASDEQVMQAQRYFRLASYRLGTLGPSLEGIQCFFLAGVYHMYNLRPLPAWQNFMNASTLYQLYEKTNYGLAQQVLDPSRGDDVESSDCSRSKDRLEQSLYWSCFKSESEFRVELPLSITDICTGHHPRMFPIPPTPPEPSGESSPDIHVGHMNIDSPISRAGPALSATSTGLRKKRPGEEESWYYYLTEIALRRIGNRIINTFFRSDPKEWMDVTPLLGIALELDAQVSSWSANLPPAMQHWQMTASIRDPNVDVSNHMSQELSWAIDNRLLEIRSWLYQPFLYCAIHGGIARAGSASPTLVHGIPSASHGAAGSDSGYPVGNTSTDNNAGRLQHLITSGVECDMKILDSRIFSHRHHGLWFDLRSLMSASLILLALVRSGHHALIPGGVEVLWGSGISTPDQIGGKIGRVLSHFAFWTTYSPDMVRHREVLEDITRQTMEHWQRQL